MKILAFDGTAKAATVAVSEDEKILGLYTIDNGLTQSELLLPMAENLLNSLKLSFNDIELFATSVGPGSFTGVRIGVSLVKGLAFGRNLPCVGVSTIEALAENYGTDVLAKLPINPDLANQCDKGLIELFECDYMERAADIIEKKLVK